MLIDNMKVIHGEETIDRLKSEKNKLYTRLQAQILDDSNFTNGTIFDEIQRINEQMSKHMQVRIDLRTNSLLGGAVNADIPSAMDRAKKQEDKLDGYILDFINLRTENDIVLEKYQKKMDEMFQKRIDMLDIRFNHNREDMMKYTQKDYDQQRQYQREIEQYVGLVHDDMMKIEEKRNSDKDHQVDLLD